MSCSVCAGKCEDSKGGVLLWERNGKISSICDDCWSEFSTTPKRLKRPRNLAQHEALKVIIT